MYTFDIEPPIWYVGGIFLYRDTLYREEYFLPAAEQLQRLKRGYFIGVGRKDFVNDQLFITEQVLFRGRLFLFRYGEILAHGGIVLLKPLIQDFRGSLYDCFGQSCKLCNMYSIRVGGNSLNHLF